eukprot:Blabericola_migrator_1__2115@NODE_1583_length_4234_cov_531_052556_g1035_i0_p2_GENE_NODE_1583_length_4234_cov_531_052556_g1035_i0NODE_1583_length_4234_cov_531_052556_g1035_i0_p2_ORF_typecomplete_len363_score58_70Adaptin_N/PF01602_20/53Adaptin_N/PF01602_20/2_6e36Cnd1/PF12717_7/2_4e02Cnd1/PF12717_7/1_6e06Cnd1/PF12717_7/12HEAT_2/PF13646_6/0_25HEAT_2/PF13646_6/1_3e02HEAT_EZ/PF13513_6/7_8e03HEAT_EZ/PF13513_6/4_3e03HEAT_EZ/PF13513_6/0_13HEAT_EZ/PF13513_6/6_7e03HEAT_EZ/PF13513_6/80Arm_2/PF04826_13/91Arm
MMSEEFEAFVFSCLNESSPADTQRHISKTINECVLQLQDSASSTDEQTEALMKLLWLCDVQQCKVSTNIFYRLIDCLAVSASHTPAHKGSLLRKLLGYLAVAAIVDPDHEGSLLLNNIILKDLGTTTDLHATLMALTFIGAFHCPTLLQSVVPQLTTLLVSSKPLIRKKALAILPRLFATNSAQISDFYELLRDRLDDADMGVLNVAIAVILEASHRDPEACVIFLPRMVRLLEVSGNPLLQTRILRYIQNIAPYASKVGSIIEDKLVGLLSDEKPVGNSITQSQVIQTLMSLQPPLQSTIDCCLRRLGEMLVSPDLNLRALALVILSNIFSLCAEHHLTVDQTLYWPMVRSTRIRTAMGDT